MPSAAVTISVTYDDDIAAGAATLLAVLSGIADRNSNPENAPDDDEPAERDVA